MSTEGRPATYLHPVVIMMSGLPGTGKSYASQRLAASLRAAIVESDRVRKELFPRPNYGPTESAITHCACRNLIRSFVNRGRSVIYDATNLIEFQRRAVYALARACAAPLIIVRTTATQDVARRRLAERRLKPDGFSDADWEVYRRLGASEEPIARGHYCVNTGEDIGDALRQIEQVVRKASETGP